MLQHDTGVLCAPTAFGKTDAAAAMIARRGVNTLVLVHRTELLRQWQERLQSFLGVGKGVVDAILKRVKARYVLGLTATPMRRDGQQPIIFMQCGPIRHTAARSEGSPNDLEVVVRSLFKRIDVPQDAGIQAVFGHLPNDAESTRPRPMYGSSISSTPAIRRYCECGTSASAAIGPWVIDWPSGPPRFNPVLTPGFEMNG